MTKINLNYEDIVSLLDKDRKIDPYIFKVSNGYIVTFKVDFIIVESSLLNEEQKNALKASLKDRLQDIVGNI